MACVQVVALGFESLLVQRAAGPAAGASAAKSPGQQVEAKLPGSSCSSAWCLLACMYGSLEAAVLTGKACCCVVCVPAGVPLC